MKKQLLTLTALGIFSFTAFSQNPGCGNKRFFESVFPTVDSTLDVKFGENISVGGDTIMLYADVYEPVADTLSNRPLVLLMHGGSFINGDRTQLHSLARAYAHAGYVAASINYRLFDGPLTPFPDSVDMGEVLIQSMGDARAALRFFRQDAATNNQFKLDTTNFIVGGVSAGAITALHAAYVDASDNLPSFIDSLITVHGGMEGNSNNITNHSSNVAGVISFSGALYRAEFIQTGNVPVYSAHDDNDQIVPYAFGYASVGPIPIISMEGSFLVHDQANQLGIASNLYTKSGNGHVAYFNNPAETKAVILESTKFIAMNVVCPGFTSVPAVSINQGNMLVYPNPAKEVVNIELNEDFNGTIRILSGNGAVIRTHLVMGQNAQINISDLPHGVYVIEALADGKAPQMKMLVVN